MCVFHMSRGARAIDQGEDQHHIVTKTCAPQFFWRVRCWHNTEAHNVWCPLDCVLCESAVLAPAGPRAAVLAPVCALSFTQ